MPLYIEGWTRSGRGVIPPLSRRDITILTHDFSRGGTVSSETHDQHTYTSPPLHRTPAVCDGGGVFAFARYPPDLKSGVIIVLSLRDRYDGRMSLLRKVCFDDFSFCSGHLQCPKKRNMSLKPKYGTWKLEISATITFRSRLRMPSKHGVKIGGLLQKTPTGQFTLTAATPCRL